MEKKRPILAVAGFVTRGGGARRGGAALRRDTGREGPFSVE